MLKKSEIVEKFKIVCKYKRLSKRTVECYESYLKRFLNDFNDSPVNASENWLQEYLGSLPSQSQHKQMVGSLKILYRDVLKCPKKIKVLRYPKKYKTLPKVISKEEVLRIIQASKSNIKHQSIITVLYESGLRISELLNLKLSDIDSNRMQILVKGGKGNKDRYSILGNNTLNLLRSYYKSYKPKVYLFEGQFGGKYSASSVRQFLNKYCQLAKVQTIHPHILRHSFATHQIESGTRESKIQLLLGHKRITTTQIYNHVTASNVMSLLD